MPQMSPLPWGGLMSLTLTLVIMISSILYFELSNRVSSATKVNKSSFSMNWSW